MLRPDGTATGAYLDHAASTPVSPAALAAMLPHLTDGFANPSGVHRAARAERRAVDDARDQLSVVLGCAPDELVFTSGGTESDNLAVLGAARGQRGQIVVSAIEHHGVLRPAASVGALVTPVDRDGVIDLDALRMRCGPSTRLVSVMSVNNEVGTIQPLGDVAEIVHREAPGAILHTDAVQALGWCAIDSLTAPFDLVSVSGHKIGAPKGIGALVVRGAAKGNLAAVLFGGPQEREMRPGTENVPGIVAFGAAAAAAAADRAARTKRVADLRDRFVDALAARIPGLCETVPRERRIVANAHLYVPGIDNEELLFLLDESGVAASAGSSCASGAAEPSHVLIAMGRAVDEARGSIRFSLGATTTEAEIDFAVAAVIDAYGRLTGASPAPGRS